MLSDFNERFSIKQYIAEIACCISKDDTELCGMLIENGIKLIQNPNMCVKEALKNTKSDGTSYAQIDHDEILSCILMSQIKIIFPIIEQFRMQFIKANDSKIRKNLPVTNAFNVKIEEPNDLELSDLCSISRNYMSDFTEEEKAILIKYRNYRNMLAHNNIINWSETTKILHTQ